MPVSDEVKDLCYRLKTLELRHSKLRKALEDRVVYLDHNGRWRDSRWLVRTLDDDE